MTYPIALTIAGSDSSGGAGIQMDMRVFSHFKVYGTTVITAITAQNLRRVTDVFPLSPRSIEKQLNAILEEFPINAVKTGMLWDEEIIKTVATFASKSFFPILIVDPVMISTSGSNLLNETAIQAYKKYLFPVSTLITPNIPEANRLLNNEIQNINEMEKAAFMLAEQYKCKVLLKGGHLEGAPVDILFSDNQYYHWKNKRLTGVNSHGTGCMLSSAITARMAQGATINTACEDGISFVNKTLNQPIIINDKIKLPGVELA